MAKRKTSAPYGFEFLDDATDLAPRFAKPPAQWAWKPHDPDGIANPPDDTSPEAVTNYAPGPRRQRIALLLGGDRDEASARILDGLRRRRVKFFKLNWEHLAREGRLTLSVGRDAAGWLQAGALRVDLRDVAAVHYDTPHLYVVEPPREEIGELVWTKRWRMVLRQLHAFVPDARWIPGRPDECGGEGPQQKLAELALARRCGLDVPETVCTNSLKDARAFLRGGPALFREFSLRGVYHKDRWNYFRVDFADARSPHFHKAAATPCVFQRWIDKRCDVRAVVVDGRVLACRIDSQASARTRMDWRSYDLENVAWTKTALPAPVARGARRLAARLGLGLVSLDFAEGRDGRFYFLEANRPGAYQWLREFAGVDVSSEIARALAEGVRAPARRRP